MGKEPWVLYLDNLRVQTSQETVAFMDQQGISYIWAPIYSPELNAIEFFFSQLKDRVWKRRLKAMVEKRQVTYDELVEDAVKKIEIKRIDKCI